MSQVHLALLIHGLYGTRVNLLSLEAELAHAHAALPQAGLTSRPEIHILLAEGIAGQLTYDGVDVQARQVAKELDQAIARLNQDGKDVTTITIYYRYTKSRMSRITHYIGPSLFSSSGRQLFCTDSYGSDGRCLLEVMADPAQRFVRALQKFETIRIIANGCHDMTVPFPTAAFSEVDPFIDFEHSGLEIELDNDQIVQSWTLPAGDAETIQGLPETLQSDIPTATSAGGRRRAIVTGTPKKKRQTWPPPVQVAMSFRFPLNYVLLSCLPVLFPLFMCYAFLTLAYHSFLSRRRMATLLSTEEKTSLLLHDALKAVSEAAGQDPVPRSIISDEDVTGLRSIGHSGTSTPVIANKIPLQLSDKQIKMSRNLNRALPHAVKIIAWFPAAYNSHAMIVLRDVKRFPAQEEARGLVRRWARMVAEAGVNQS